MIVVVASSLENVASINVKDILTVVASFVSIGAGGYIFYKTREMTRALEKFKANQSYINSAIGKFEKTLDAMAIIGFDDCKDISMTYSTAYAEFIKSKHLLNPKAKEKLQTDSKDINSLKSLLVSQGKTVQSDMALTVKMSTFSSEFIEAVNCELHNLTCKVHMLMEDTRHGCGDARN